MQIKTLKNNKQAKIFGEYLNTQNCQFVNNEMEQIYAQDR